MRLVKKLSFAAIAAAASMAFVGLSSAQANGSTALCNNTSLPCNSVYTGHLELLSTIVQFLGVADITCLHSKLLGNALGLGSPQVTHIEEMTLSSCESCSINVIDKTGLATTLKTAPNLGTYTSEGFAVLVECIGVHCVWGGLPEGVHVKGGSVTLSGTGLATIVVNKVELRRLSGGFFCGSNVFMDATYTLLLPHALFISS